MARPTTIGTGGAEEEDLAAAVLYRGSSVVSLVPPEALPAAEAAIGEAEAAEAGADLAAAVISAEEEQEEAGEQPSI